MPHGRPPQGRQETGATGESGREGRADRKRRAILAAATDLFLERGYAATSMDQVATAASASKQTVYAHFGDKESLFREIVMATTTSTSRPFETVIAEVGGAADPLEALRGLARSYLTAVLTPEVLRCRLLVVREAGRLPDLARAYHQAVPARVLEALARTLARLDDRGVLRVPDPARAAGHFAFLVIGQPLDTAMFLGYRTVAPEDQRTAMADAAAGAFLAAYRA